MLRRLTWSHIFLLVLVGWLFFLPSNLFLKFGENQAYVHGLLSDYLLVKLYLSDFFSIVLIAFCWWPHLKKELSIPQRHGLVLLVLTLVLAGRQFFVPHPLAATWMFARLAMLILLVVGLDQQRFIQKHKLIFWSLTGTVIFQTLLAGYQFWFQKSLAGYYFFGEPDLGKSFSISQGVFDGAEKILPYGTTAHPNILAGVCVVYTIIIWLIFLNTKSKSVLSKVAVGGTLVASLLVCWMTQSWAASLLLLTGMAILFVSVRRSLLPKIKPLLLTSVIIGLIAVPLALPWFTTYGSPQPSVDRRAYLNQAAINIITTHPITGVGLNQTTAVIEAYTENSEIVRFVQPIHHAGLVWITETGLVGLSLLGLGVGYWKRQQDVLLASFVLLPVLASDHYLITLTSGQLLLVLCIWSCSLLSVKQRLA